MPSGQVAARNDAAAGTSAISPTVDTGRNPLERLANLASAWARGLLWREAGDPPASDSMATAPHTLLLNILMIREGDHWVAQCLDFDIASQGRSVKEAQEAFSSVFAAHVVSDLQNQRPILSRVGPAPDWYWDRFYDAVRLTSSFPVRMPSLPAGVPPAEVIHARAEDVRVY